MSLGEETFALHLRAAGIEGFEREYRAIGAALALGAELADSTNRRTVAAAIKTVFQEAGR